MRCPSRMRTFAPAPGTLPPSQVAAADQGPLFAERRIGAASSPAWSSDAAAVADIGLRAAMSTSRFLHFDRDMVGLLMAGSGGTPRRVVSSGGTPLSLRARRSQESVRILQSPVVHGRLSLAARRL